VDGINFVNGLISAINPFGNVVGTLIAGNLVNLGRRKAYLITNFIFIFGCLIIMFGGLFSIVLGRFISCLASGIYIVLIPKFLFEISPTKYVSYTGLLP